MELKLNCPASYKNEIRDYSRTYFSFSISNKTNDNFTSPNSQGLLFVAFNDKVSKTTASYDVLGFYISFILVIGRVLRSFISGEPERIFLTEMSQPKPLMNLCEGVKMSRYRHDFVKEEQLYYVLIDLVRSPEILKVITKSSLHKLRMREINSVKLHET